MKEFLARFGSGITSVLSGFDRVIFRGTLQSLMRTGGMQWFLQDAGVPIPSEPAWHRRLSDLFGPEHLPRLLELIDAPLCEQMDRCLGFRRVFVHGYAVDLDWERLKPAAGSRTSSKR